jgi:hypothetical protein
VLKEYFWKEDGGDRKSGASSKIAKCHNREGENRVAISPGVADGVWTRKGMLYVVIHASKALPFLAMVVDGWVMTMMSDASHCTRLMQLSAIMISNVAESWKSKAGPG